MTEFVVVSVNHPGQIDMGEVSCYITRNIKIPAEFEGKRLLVTIPKGTVVYLTGNSGPFIDFDNNLSIVPGVEVIENNNGQSDFITGTFIVPCDAITPNLKVSDFIF